MSEPTDLKTNDDDDFGFFEENIATANTSDSIDNILHTQSADAGRQYITFTINEEEYGTPILTVQEIRGWMKTTPLPNTPEYVRGVTNLRGNIVPVFDMRTRFSGELTEVTQRHVVIIVELESRSIGLLVDSISDILTIDESQIQPAPTGNLTVDTQYLDGLVTSDDRMVALININKLFENDNIQEMAQKS